MPSVSIIIPVYNVESYLRECLDSLLANTFTEWEALCIDDGSTDASGSILDEYGANDTRFRIVHIPNGGVSQARNTGIALAQAPYLLMIDPDDRVEPSMIAELYTAITQDHSDLAVCGHFLHQTDGNIAVCPPMKKGDDQGYSKTRPSYAEHITPYLWNKMYRREIFRKHNILFDKDIPINEDLLLNQLYLLHTESVSIIPKPLYHYRSREGSTVWRYSAGNAPTHCYELIVSVLLKPAEIAARVMPSGTAKRWIGHLFSLALHQIFLNERVLFHSHHPGKNRIRKTGLRCCWELFCRAPLHSFFAILTAIGILTQKVARKLLHKNRSIS